MLVISTRDFRANQTKFLDMVNKGEDIVLKSRGKGSFKLVPVREHDAIVDKRDILAELKGALQQVKDHKDGKIELKSAEGLLNELRDYNL
ncbi:MAG: type II toxin-antitoxin system prevent-host-death family antitoxin [Prevotella sp.]|nr:type II toxin-antitoxin system prevent-host-death family antitoxin [Prevotella sp.]